MKQSIRLLIVLILFSCGKKQPAEAVVEDELIRVVPVNYPLYYFAERIGGKWIDLAYPIPSGVDQAYWNPDEQALIVYQ